MGLQHKLQIKQEFKVEQHKISLHKNGKTSSLKLQQHAHCFFSIQTVVNHEFVPQGQTKPT